MKNIIPNKYKQCSTAIDWVNDRYRQIIMWDGDDIRVNDDYSISDEESFEISSDWFLYLYLFMSSDEVAEYG